MKKLLTTFGLLLTLAATTHAQTPPDAFSYSAVARDANSNPIANTTIGIQISLRLGSPLGTVVYQENHFVNTDQFGLFNLTVGGGSVQSGNISTIDWAAANHYLQVGMDANGGNNFLTMGTTQLLSVPYALYAKSAGTVGGGGNFSGDYNDLTNAPTLSPVAISGDYNDLTNIPTIPVVPTNVSAFANDAGYVSTTFSGDYNDLTNAPIAVTSISANGDTLYLSNGQAFVAGGSGTFTHYIGEEFGGGVIFHLWLDANGAEHGLIVDKTDLSTAQAWSNMDQTLIGPAAQSSWDGLSNSNAIVGQAGHTNSAAALCLNSTNGGQSDWYLPSQDELSLLWHNRFNVNKSLSTIGGATVLPNVLLYWSSREHSNDRAWSFGFHYDSQNYVKTTTGYVRAVRAF